MKRTSLEKTIMWMVISLLAISILFCFNLLIVEYIRILILGISLAIVCVTYPGEFQKSNARVSFIAGSYAYMLWLFDPAINGVAFFGEGAITFNFYRVISLSVLLIATFLWLFPLLTRKISYKVFARKFTQGDIYVLIAIFSIGIMKNIDIQASLFILHRMSITAGPYRSNKIGRPTKYSAELLDKAQHYLDNYEEYDEVIPSAVGLALVLNLTRSTLYEWAKAEDKKEFSDILDNINKISLFLKSDVS